MSFLELYNKDVSKFIEKKNNLNYLSWSYAVKELKIAYPEATYKQVYFNNVPYFVDKSGSYVAVKLFLTKEDRKDDFYQDLTFPVLDFKNKTVFEPNSFQVNTAFMRCLTKLIGMATGLGLSLYSGEDIPREEETKSSKKEEIKTNNNDEQFNNITNIHEKTPKNRVIEALQKGGLVMFADEIESIKKTMTFDYDNLIKFDSFCNQLEAKYKADKGIKAN